MIIIYCDGCCETRNPGGYACWGWIAYENGKTVNNNNGCIGRGEGMTNNVAEYEAVLQALRWAKENHLMSCRFRTDSQLVVNQVRGNWQINALHLIPKIEEARKLLKATGSIIEWVPKEQNESADKLSRIAYSLAKQAVVLTFGTQRKSQIQFV